MKRPLQFLVLLLAAGLSPSLLAETAPGCLDVDRGDALDWSLSTIPAEPNWQVASHGFTYTGAEIPFTATFWRRAECPSQLLLTMDASPGIIIAGLWYLHQDGDTALMTDMTVNSPSFGGHIYQLTQFLTPGAISGVVNAQYSGTPMDLSKALTITNSPVNPVTGAQAPISVEISAASSGVSGITLNQRGLTGTWADPTTSGQGIVMEVAPDFFSSGNGLLFGGWYTFDAATASKQHWYTLQGQVTSTSASAIIPIYETLGGQFDAATPTTTTAVGEATLRFEDCNRGNLTYSFTDGRRGVIPLTRLLPNSTCH